MLRMILKIILVLVFISSCTPKESFDQSPYDADISLSVTSVASDILDAAFTIESIRLKNKSSKVTISEGFSSNFSNFDLLPYLIEHKRQITEDIYTHLEIRMTFKPDFKIRYVNTEGGISSMPVYSASGKELGKEQEAVTVQIPFLNSPKGVSFIKNQPTHINILFNIDSMMRIHETESGHNSLVEFNPGLLTATTSSEPQIVILQGKISGVVNKKIDINTGLSAAPIELIITDNSQIVINNNPVKSLSTITRNSTVYAKSLLAGASLSATEVKIIDSDVSVIKGIVVGVQDDVIDILGGVYSNFAYLTTENQYHKVSKNSINLPDSLIAINTPVTVWPDMPEGDNNAFEESNNALPSQLDINKGLNNDTFLSVFYVYAVDSTASNDDKLITIKALDGKIMTRTEEQYWPYEYAQNLTEGTYIGDIKFNLKKSGLSDRQWKATITNQPIKLAEEDSDYYSYNYHYADGSYNQEPKKPFLLRFVTDNNAGYLTLRLLGNENQASETIDFLHYKTGIVDTTCESIELRVNEESTLPFLINILSADRENDEIVTHIVYIATNNEALEWFSTQDNQLYLRELVLSGNLISASKKQACQFDTGTIQLTLLDNAVADDKFQRLFNLYRKYKKECDLEDCARNLKITVGVIGGLSGGLLLVGIAKFILKKIQYRQFEKVLNSGISDDNLKILLNITGDNEGTQIARIKESINRQFQTPNEKITRKKLNEYIKIKDIELTINKKLTFDKMDLTIDKITKIKANLKNYKYVSPTSKIDQIEFSNKRIDIFRRRK